MCRGIEQIPHVAEAVVDEMPVQLRCVVGVCAVAVLVMDGDVPEPR